MCIIEPHPYNTRINQKTYQSIRTAALSTALSPRIYAARIGEKDPPAQRIDVLSHVVVKLLISLRHHHLHHFLSDSARLDVAVDLVHRLFQVRIELRLPDELIVVSRERFHNLFDEFGEFVHVVLVACRLRTQRDCLLHDTVDGSLSGFYRLVGNLQFIFVLRRSCFVQGSLSGCGGVRLSKLQNVCRMLDQDADDWNLP